MLRVVQLSGEVLLEESFSSSTRVSDVRSRVLEHLRKVHPETARQGRVQLLLGGKMLEGDATLGSLDLPAPPAAAELQLVRLTGKVFTKHTGAGDQIPRVATPPFKLLVLGHPHVGKTSIMTRYVDGVFSPLWHASIGIDFKIVVLERDDGTMRKLQIWDHPCGKERFRAITQSYFRGAHGVLLVFSVDCRDSFEAVSQHLKSARQYGREQIIAHVVATKTDVEPSQRVVTEEEAQEFCDKEGLTYHEVSSKNDTGIDETFSDIVSELEEVDWVPPLVPPTPAPAPQAQTWTPCSIQ